MGFFQEVEGEAAVLVENGVYKQVPLFTRDGFLYAKASGGFVRLMADGATTRTKMRLDFMTWTGPLCRDGLNRLCTDHAAGAKPLGDGTTQKLLGAVRDDG